MVHLQACNLRQFLVLLKIYYKFIYFLSGDIIFSIFFL